MMSRSSQHTEGYRRAAKDAIEWLHDRASEMNDPHARSILNSAAYSLGVAFGSKDVIPTKSRTSGAAKQESEHA